MRLTGADLLEHCLGKPGAWQDEPWEGDLVAKVGDKIFAFLGGGDSDSVGIKCGNNREEADELVDTYPEDVSKMAYIGRSGWNTVRLGGKVPDDEILELVETSYQTIVAKLPKSRRPSTTT
jgi:predicted DNA-binding protein (MmcQ/YjbR family)